MHGCDWLIERWENLIERLEDRDEPWNPTERAQALDLLGVPLEAREGITRVDRRDREGKALRDHQIALASNEIDRLRQRQTDALEPLDDQRRAVAEIGSPFHESAEMRRLRRYETASDRRIRWALAELRKLRRGPISPSPVDPILDLDDPNAEDDLDEDFFAAVSRNLNSPPHSTSLQSLNGAFHDPDFDFDDNDDDDDDDDDDLEGLGLETAAAPPSPVESVEAPATVREPDPQPTPVPAAAPAPAPAPAPARADASPSLLAGSTPTLAMPGRPITLAGSLRETLRSQLPNNRKARQARRARQRRRNRA